MPRQNDREGQMGRALSKSPVEERGRCLHNAWCGAHTSSAARQTHAVVSASGDQPMGLSS
jgi:hypothetical protein